MIPNLLLAIIINPLGLDSGLETKPTSEKILRPGPVVWAAPTFLQVEQLCEELRTPEQDFLWAQKRPKAWRVETARYGEYVSVCGGAGFYSTLSSFKSGLVLILNILAKPVSQMLLKYSLEGGLAGLRIMSPRHRRL